MANPKKRERSGFDEFAIATSVKKARTRHTGADFQKKIRDLSKERISDISRKVELPLTYGPSDKDHALTLDATFSTKTHAKDAHEWTQGWLDLGGSTKYVDILPASISLQRATVESQVLKKLALGDTYVPRNTVHFATNNKTTLKGEISSWGRPALQSYLEEATGRLSLGVKDIGSGIRAMILASKLRLRSSGLPAPSEAGFQTRVLKFFPQLLTGDSVPPGGAALLNQKIFGEESASVARPTHTQSKLIRKNIRAHKEANYEIRKRFNQKWDEIVGGKKAKHAGKWWADKFGGQTKSFDELNRHLSQNRIKKSALRTEYLQDKLARHGITYVNK